MWPFSNPARQLASIGHALGKVGAIGFATAALVRFAHRSPSVSAHSGNGRLSQLEADLDRRLAERRARRPQRQAAARKGWQTRRAGQ